MLFFIESKRIGYIIRGILYPLVRMKVEAIAGSRSPRCILPGFLYGAFESQIWLNAQSIIFLMGGDRTLTR